MMIEDILKAEHIYLACGATDLRKSVDGLVSIVTGHFKLNPFSNSIFYSVIRKKINSKH